MDSEQWRMRLFPIETRPAWAKELVSDLAESEREAGVLRDALAESERLRAKAEDDRNQWRSACADETNRAARAEAKVAAYVKLVAQSSTQYREMVSERDRMAWWIVNAPLKYPVIDHACSECDPGSTMVVIGWRCAYHEALWAERSTS